MRLIGLLLFLGLAAFGCTASDTGNPNSAAATSKPENPDLVEHRRLMAEQAKFKKRFLASLPRMQVEHVYYIDPMADPSNIPAKDLIQGYRVLSHAKVSSQQSSSGVLQRSLRSLIESNPDSMAMCFDPHHVVSLKDGDERFDAVVCFDCGNYRIFSPKGDWLLSGAFVGDEEPKWDKVFSASGLKRPAHDLPH